jgi:hypothetical protein
MIGKRPPKGEEGRSRPSTHKKAKSAQRPLASTTPNETVAQASVPIRWRNAVRDHPSMSPRGKLVGYVLSTYMDAKGSCWPSKPMIATGCGYANTKSVYHGVQELIFFGLLDIPKRRHNHSNVYQATFPIVGTEVPTKLVGTEIPDKPEPEYPLSCSTLSNVGVKEQELPREQVPQKRETAEEILERIKGAGIEL